MKRKLFSAILFGALLTASTSGLTSCKDYDDDISNLQSQIDKLATADQLSAKVSEMKAAIDAARSAAEAKAAAAQTVADAASKAADAAAAAASKAQGTADDAAKAAAAAAEVGKAAQAAVDKLAAEAATKAELEAAKDAAAAAVKAIQDAHATDKAAIEKAIADSKDELLKKINENAAALAALDTRLTAVEAQLKAIIDGEGGETSLEAIADEVEAISDALEDLIGAFTMATSIDIYNGVNGYDNDLNFWKVKEAVTAEFPREANAKEADGKAYEFKTGTERVYEDSVLVRVNPVDATLDAEHIVLLNSQGAEISSDLVECVEARAFSSNLLTRAAGNGTGLWVVKFKATDKLLSDKDVQKEFKAATELGNKKILFALGTDESYEAAEVDRRLVTAYALAMGCDDAKRASEFKVNGTPVADIKNRFTTSEEGVQVPKDVYGIDYKWRYIDEDGEKNPVVNTKIVTPAEDEDNYTVVNDDKRNDKPVLVAEVGQSIIISFPTDKPIKGFYVTLDYKRAIESAASEINAWNTYEYENVAKINKKGEVIEPATLQNGNIGYIQVNDLKDYATVGDVIGFRVFAVNLDGTLVDPDGQAFYVGFGESEEIADEKEIAAQTIEVKYAANTKDKKNITDFIDVEDAFSGVTFDNVKWTASEGADEYTPTVKNENGDVNITYYNAKKEAIAEKDFGSNGNFWEDVKYIKAEIAKPTYLVDDATYTLTATLGVKVGNSSYKVRTVTMPLTKKMPTTLADEYALKFEALQGEEQVVVPTTSGTPVSPNQIENGRFNAAGVWEAYVNDTKTPGLKDVYNLKTPWAGTINLNAIYRFTSGKYLKDVAEVKYMVEKSVENTTTNATEAKDQTFSTTSTPTLEAASFAGNFINGSSYNVKAVYTYKDISRKKVDVTTGVDPTDSSDEDDIKWSERADASSATAVVKLQNDYVAKVSIPSIKLMPWSSEKYLAFDWNKKCVAAAVAATGNTPAKDAVYEPNNEIAIASTEGAEINIHLANIQVFLGNEIKSLPALTNGLGATESGAWNADKLSNACKMVTWNMTVDPKHGWTSGSNHGNPIPNVWTETEDGTVNAYFAPSGYTDHTITLKQLKSKVNTPAHKEYLCVEMVDCFGNKRVIKLQLRIVENYTTVYTPDGTAGSDGNKKWYDWNGISNDANGKPVITRK